MQRIYLDNAATTPLDPLVLEEMLPYFTEKFGNPSSIYSYGREARMAIEKSRKSIAHWLNVKPGEIFFTSCGTESSNTAIHASLRDLKCTRIITSLIEHHATLHTVQFLQHLGLCEVCYVELDKDGMVDLNHLEEMLSGDEQKTLVTLMHANNEIGNLLDLASVSQICQQYGAYFHTDAVQTTAHYALDLQKNPVHFLSASGHKFHGPKGIGILYINQNIQIKPLIHGGSQERLMRAGTENVANIVGIGKAMDLAMENLEKDSTYIKELKEYLLNRLRSEFTDIHMNGCQEPDKSLYTVVNISFPKNDKTEALSMNLDMLGICVSGGSACSSGSQGGSHVISKVYPEMACVPIRISMSKHSTRADLDELLTKIKELL